MVLVHQVMWPITTIFLSKKEMQIGLLKTIINRYLGVSFVNKFICFKQKL